MSDITGTNPNEGNLAHLREQASQAAAARAEAEQLKRELLFAKAGIDTETKLGKMLFKTFEGDDLAALKAEAAEIGALGAPAPAGGTTTPPAQPAATVTDTDRYAQHMREQLSPGGTPEFVPPENPHPIDAGYKQFRKDRDAGVREEEAIDRFLDGIFRAASEGDKRVLFDPAEWAQKAAVAGQAMRTR